jgi:hypothetical protein
VGSGKLVFVLGSWIVMSVKLKIRICTTDISVDERSEKLLLIFIGRFISTSLTYNYKFCNLTTDSRYALIIDLQ